MTRLQSGAFRALAVCMAVSTAGPAFCQSTWTATASGTWDNPANWAGGVVPVSGPGTVVEFTPPGAGLSYDANNNLGPVPFQLNQLNFLAGAGTVNRLVGNALEFVNNGAAEPTVTVSSSSQAVIRNAVILGDDLTFTGGNPGNFFQIGDDNTDNGRVSGTASVTFAFTGTTANGVSIFGRNTYTGGTVFNSNAQRFVVPGNNEAFGTGTLTLTAGGVRPTINRDIQIANPVVVNGAAFTLGVSTNNSRLTFTGPIDLAGGTRTITMPGGGEVILAGTIGNGSLVKNGGGLLTLAGDNAMTSLTVSAGVIGVFRDANLGAAGAAVTFNGSAGGLRVFGTEPMTSARQFNFDVTTGVNVFNPGGVTLDGPLVGSGGLTKSGPGPLTLRGANSFTGNTTVRGGGPLTLDYRGDNTDKISPTGGLNSAGSLILIGSDSAPTVQTVAGFTADTGTARTTVVSGTGQSATLNLGAVSRTNRGTADFTLPASGAVTTTTANSSGGLLVAGAITVGGADWATNSGGTIAAFTAYAADVYAAETNTAVVGGTAPADFTTHTLRFGSNAPAALAVSGLNTVQTGGVLFAPDSPAAVSVTGGSLRPGTGFGGDLNFHVNRPDAVVTVDSAITNNGATNIGISKIGPGTLILTNPANTFGGRTFVTGGVLEIAADGSLGTVPASASENVVLAGGTLRFGAGVTSLSTTRTVALVQPTGTIDTNGNDVTFAGTITNATGNTTLIKTGAGTLSLTGSSKSFFGLDIRQGSVLTTGAQALGNNFQSPVTLDEGTTLDLRNNTATNYGNPFALAPTATAATVNINRIDGTGGVTQIFGRLTLAGGQTFTATQAGPATGHTLGFLSLELTGTGPVTINPSGPAVEIRQAYDRGNAVGLVKTGTSTLNLRGVNQLSGGLSINQGTVNASGSGSLGGAANTVTLGNGTTLQLRSDGSGVTDTVIDFGAALVYTGSAGSATFNVGRNNAPATANTLQLGPLTIEAGKTLNVTGGNAYAGRFPSATFTGGGDVTFNPTSANLHLGAVAASAAGVVKNGTGILFLDAGTHSYTGPTAINNGQLRVNGTLAGAGSDVTVGATGVLGGFGTIERTTRLETAGGILAPGGELQVNGIGTLTITQPVTVNNAAIFAWQSATAGPASPFNSGGSTVLSQMDRLAVSEFGSLNFDGAVIRPAELTAGDFATTFDPNAEYSWTIATVASGTVSTLGATFDLSQAPTLNNAVTVLGGTLTLSLNFASVNLNYTPVPEPTVVLAWCGLAAGLVAWRRRAKPD